MVPEISECVAIVVRERVCIIYVTLGGTLVGKIRIKVRRSDYEVTKESLPSHSRSRVLSRIKQRSRFCFKSTIMLRH